MRKTKRKFGCPVEFSIDLLSGKWKTVILSRLAAPKAGILEVAGLVFIISAVIIGVFVLALGVPLTLGI